MVKVDEFQSIFRAAEREAFAYRPPTLARATLVTDRDHEAPASNQESAPTQESIVRFLPATAGCEWTVITVETGAAVSEVTAAVEASRPDVVATFRHLGEASLVPQHSLGVYLDVLTQVMPQPVLVLPGTAADRIALPGEPADSVMAVTDHVRGEQRLISAAAAVAPPRSTLWLCHVEDDAVFERFLHAIAQIPELDTDLARKRIAEVLTGEAMDYLQRAKEGLQSAGLDLTIVPHLSQGHRIRAFRDLIATHATDLVVANTKDDDQLAMHGVAYALAVELIDTPLLLL